MKDAWINYITNTSSSPFSASGTTNGINITGSGTETGGQLTSSTFEGKQALAKTMTVTGTVSGSGQTASIASTSTGYYDLTYNLLGSSSQTEYFVVDSITTPIANGAKVNDTGVLFTTKRYTDSSKSSLVGTAEYSFVLEPDTADTAFFKLIAVEKDNSGAIENTSTLAFRITPTGGITKLYETALSSNSSLKVTFSN